MAQQTGTAFKIYLSGGQIAYLRSNELGNSTNMIDISNKESGEFKEVMPGQKEYSGSAEGFVEYINRNVLNHTEAFDNAAWTKDDVTVDDDFVTTPYGANGADKLTFTGEGDSIYQTITRAVAANQVWIASVWLRAAAPCTVTLVSYNDDSTDGTGVTCNLTTTWQRFTVAHTFAGIETGVRLSIQTNTGDTALVVYAWGAQLEQGSANNTLPTTYQPKPRVDYNDLFTAITNETSYTALMSAKTTGQDAFQGTAYISNLQMAAPNAEAQTFTCDIAFSGQLSIV